MSDRAESTLKARITRLRNASKSSALNLAQKLALKAQVKAAENELRVYRLAKGETGA